MLTVRKQMQHCNTWTSLDLLLFFSVCQGLPGTLHDLNGDLLVSFQSCTCESSMMAALRYCRVLSALSLSPAVSCNLSPWSGWCSWNARIQGKYWSSVFICSEWCTPPYVSRNIHNSCCPAPSCLSIFAHLGSHRAQRRQGRAWKRWREGDFILWLWYFSCCHWYHAFNAQKRINLLYGFSFFV